MCVWAIYTRSPVWRKTKEVKIKTAYACLFRGFRNTQGYEIIGRKHKARFLGDHVSFIYLHQIYLLLELLRCCVLSAKNSKLLKIEIRLIFCCKLSSSFHLTFFKFLSFSPQSLAVCKFFFFIYFLIFTICLIWTLGRIF